MNMVVVGLGYVGLPLALQFCRSGVRASGLDADRATVSPCVIDTRNALGTHLNGAVPAARADGLWLA